MNGLQRAPELHGITAEMRTIVADLRYAFRLFSGSPGFALVAVLSLALGIASTATVFTWIDTLLLHPFPGAVRSGELSMLEMQIPSAPNGGTSISWPDYIDFRDHLKLVSGLALQRTTAFALGDEDDARLVWGELVSGGYFQTLGVRPLLGTVFSDPRHADTPGAYPVAVISERLWRSYFRADPIVVGRTVHLNRRPLTIIGVASAAFHGTVSAMLLDVWVPASMSAELGLTGRSEFTDRNARGFDTMIVRRRARVTNERAEAEAKALAATLAAAYPMTNRGVSATVIPPWRIHSGAGELLLNPLRILMAVAVLLLLVVCANVGNLLLARSVARRQEFGIRIAMGASRWRVARQLVTETFFLAGTAAVVGTIMWSWMAPSLTQMTPSVGLPLAHEFQLNYRILGFTVLVCAAAALLSGLAPAPLCFSPDVNEVLKEGGRRASPSTGARRTRSLLVIVEVAMAATALIGSGLFVRSFRNARSIHPGFNARHVLFGRFFIESTGYSGDQIERLMLRLRAQLSSQAGVEAVSYSDFTPFSGSAGPYDTIRVDGYAPRAGESMNVNDCLVSPGHFDALRIPLLSGRDFTTADDRTALPVMIVNQEFARRYFHGGTAVGRKVQIGRVAFTVIGLAADSKYFRPSEPQRPYFYTAFRQFYTGSHEIDLFLRTSRAPEQAIPMLRRVVAQVDPAASAFHAVPLAEYTQVATFGEYLAATLMGALGVICLLLAALGIYSVMSYSVNQRTQEIGIRLAMGARRMDVIGMVVRQGMGLALAGLIIGMLAALAAARAVAGMLIQVDAADPFTFVAAGAFLLLVSLIATWLPARRATRIDPITALRRE